MTYTPEHRDDVIIESDGTGMGTILGIILAIVVVLAIVWFFFLGGMGNGNSNPGTDTNNGGQPQVEQPVNPGDGLQNQAP
jgi:hypothetical protein